MEGDGWRVIHGVLQRATRHPPRATRMEGVSDVREGWVSCWGAAGFGG